MFGYTFGSNDLVEFIKEAIRDNNERYTKWNNSQAVLAAPIKRARQIKVDILLDEQRLKDDNPWLIRLLRDYPGAVTIKFWKRRVLWTAALEGDHSRRGWTFAHWPNNHFFMEFWYL